MTPWMHAHAGPGWYWLYCPVNPYHGDALDEPLVVMAHVLDPHKLHPGQMRPGIGPSVVDLFTDRGDCTPWLIENLPPACRWRSIERPTFEVTR